MDLYGTKVAVVGTGMAGLTCAFLLNRDDRNRYDVRVFESGASFSLDSASMSVSDAKGQRSRIDIPMRALTSGYYPTLKAMYDFMGIECRPQKMRFIFSQERLSEEKDQAGLPYFIHSSNNHQFPPTRPQGLGVLRYSLELFFVATFYLWFTICCWLIPPKDSSITSLSETLEEYLARIWIPHRFTVLYLLPLMSAVATCSHQELLSFPASDLVEYRKAILFGAHMVVCGGVQKVQDFLVNGLAIRTRSKVTRVCTAGQGVTLTIEDESGLGPYHEQFDQVILAVPPDAAASMFPAAERQLRRIPTREVTTLVHVSSSDDEIRRTRGVEDIYLCTSKESGGWTNATHHHGGGISVTSNCGGDSAAGHSISRSRFTRTLRTPISKAVVDSMFEHRPNGTQMFEKAPAWTNGAEGVWMTGAWCWNGMVLLEGAAVSATRVAKAFDVKIPWERSMSTR